MTTIPENPFLPSAENDNPFLPGGHSSGNPFRPASLGEDPDYADFMERMMRGAGPRTIANFGHEETQRLYHDLYLELGDEGPKVDNARMEAFDSAYHQGQLDEKLDPGIGPQGKLMRGIGAGLQPAIDIGEFFYDLPTQQWWKSAVGMPEAPPEMQEALDDLPTALEALEALQTPGVTDFEHAKRLVAGRQDLDGVEGFVQDGAEVAASIAGTFAGPGPLGAGRVATQGGGQLAQSALTKVAPNVGKAAQTTANVVGQSAAWAGYEAARGSEGNPFVNAAMWPVMLGLSRAGGFVSDKVMAGFGGDLTKRSLLDPALRWAGASADDVMVGAQRHKLIQDWLRAGAPGAPNKYWTQTVETLRNTPGLVAGSAVEGLGFSALDAEFRKGILDGLERGFADDDWSQFQKELKHWGTTSLGVFAIKAGGIGNIAEWRRETTRDIEFVQPSGIRVQIGESKPDTTPRDQGRKPEDAPESPERAREVEREGKEAEPSAGLVQLAENTYGFARDAKGVFRHPSFPTVGFRALPDGTVEPTRSMAKLLGEGVEPMRYDFGQVQQWAVRAALEGRQQMHSVGTEGPNPGERFVQGEGGTQLFSYLDGKLHQRSLEDGPRGRWTPAKEGADLGEVSPEVQPPDAVQQQLTRALVEDLGRLERTPTVETATQTAKLLAEVGRHDAGVDAAMQILESGVFSEGLARAKDSAGVDRVIHYLNHAASGLMRPEVAAERILGGSKEAKIDEAKQQEQVQEAEPGTASERRPDEGDGRGQEAGGEAKPGRGEEQGQVAPVDASRIEQGARDPSLSQKSPDDFNKAPREEGGSVPLPSKEAVSKIGVGLRAMIRGPVEVAKVGTDWWSKRVDERIAMKGGEEGQRLAEGLRQAHDHYREGMGELSRELFEFDKLVSGRFATPRQRAQAEAARSLRESRTEDGETHFRAAMEGRLDNLPAREQVVVEKARELVHRVGEMFEQHGAKIKTGDGEWIDFRANADRRVLPRNFTQEGHVVLQKRGPAFDEFVKEVSRLNPGLTVEKAREIMVEHAEQLAMGDIVRDSIEHVRTLDRMPDQITVDGKPVQMLESDPVMIRGLVDRAIRRLGVLRQFGQDIDGTAGVQAAIDRYTKAGGDRELANIAFRAQHGAPTHRPIGTEPGSDGYIFQQQSRTLLRLAASAALTKSVIPNIPETVGTPAGFFGVREVAKAWADLAVNYRSARQELEELGAIQRDVINWVARDGRRLEDMGSSVSTSINTAFGNRPMNALNEIVVAKAAKRIADNMRAGNARVRDELLLELMHFTPENVESMIAGKAEQKLYDRFVREAGPYLMGTGLGTQQSAASHNPLYRAGVRFDQFARNKFARTTQLIDHAMRTVRDPNASGKKKATAAYMLGEYFVGSAGSGAAAMLLRFGVGYGVVAMVQYLQDWEERPGEALYDATWYAVVGGPGEPIASAMLEGGADKRDLSEAATRAIFPLEKAMEAFTAITGQGPYSEGAGVTTWGRALKFLERQTAVAQDARRMLSLAGLADGDYEIEGAFSAFYRARKRYGEIGIGTAPGGGKAEEYWKRARFHLERYEQLIKRGVPRDDPRYREHIREAFAIKVSEKKDVDAATTSIGAALKGRRILSGANWTSLKPEQQTELLDSLHPNYVRALRRYDALLVELADSL